MHFSPRTQFSIIGFLTALLAACEASPEPGVIVADSAGVRLINVASDHVPVEVVDSVPDLVIGDGSEFHGLVFDGILGVAVLRDSSVLVTDRDQQIIRIDPGTRAVRRFGRAGDGPLEFRGLRQVFEMPDGHFLAVDYGRRRIVDLTQVGELHSEIRFPEVGSPGAQPFVVPSVPISLQTVYVAVIPGFADSDGDAYRGVGAVVALLNSADTLAVFRGPATFGGSGATGGVMFGATTLFAGSEDGIWLGDTGGQSVELRSPARGVSTIVRWSTADSRELNADRIAEFWSRLESALPPEQRAGVPAMRRRLPFADSVPGFGSLIVSPPHVWIGSVLPPEVSLLDLAAPPQEWLVVDYNVGTARRIVTPAGFTLRHATDVHVLGVHRDDLGVETIRRYSLPPGH